MTSILRTHLLSQFFCLGDRCEDTCCQNWSMQVDQDTLNRYRKEAPQLLDAVEPGIDTPFVMRKDPASGFCVKLENGFCGIHKAHGDKFLGDACHFYPRVTRRIEGRVVMTATMSCPEVVRLALTTDSPCQVEPADIERLPHTMKDYQAGISADDALEVHRAFLAATDDNDATPERIFLRIASVSRSMERLDRKTWKDAVPFYLQNADARLPEAKPDAADPFNLLHALCGLIVASKRAASPRLKQTIADMEKALAATLDWEQVLINVSEQSGPAWQSVRAKWQADAYAPYLRRWLQMQLSLALYPFAGLGSNLTERVTIIGVRLATVKLALMCAHAQHGTLPQGEVVRTVQSLSRLLDHLGDPAFSLQIYNETGWVNEPRMRTLVEM